jgi:DNA-binding NarL/FixJ family response regulator
MSRRVTASQVQLQHKAEQTKQILDQLPIQARRVAELLAQGYTDYGIARQLGLGRQTVSAHVTHLYLRFGIVRTKDVNARVSLARQLWPVLEFYKLNYQGSKLAP